MIGDVRAESRVGALKYGSIVEHQLAGGTRWLRNWERVKKEENERAHGGCVKTTGSIASFCLVRIHDGGTRVATCSRSTWLTPRGCRYAYKVDGGNVFRDTAP